MWHLLDLWVEIWILALGQWVGLLKGKGLIMTLGGHKVKVLIVVLK
jgi:hypothetical protein